MKYYLDMNTKKAFILHKDEKSIKKTLHTLSYIENEKTTILFNTLEEGDVKLSLNKDDGVLSSFLVFILPDYYISFGSEIKVINGKDSYSFPSCIKNEILFKKEKEVLHVFVEGKEVFFLSSPIIKSSLSLGVETRGKGKCELIVF